MRRDSFAVKKVQAGAEEYFSRAGQAGKMQIDEYICNLVYASPALTEILW